jgi:hypothetical protein
MISDVAQNSWLLERTPIFIKQATDRCALNTRIVDKDRVVVVE